MPNRRVGLNKIIIRCHQCDVCLISSSCKNKSDGIRKTTRLLHVRLAGHEVCLSGGLMTEDGPCKEHVKLKIGLACTAFGDSEKCGEKIAFPMEPR